MAAFVLFVFGEQLGQWLAELAGYGATFAAVWDVARWPVLVGFVVLALAVLYWAGPAIAHSFRWITPGAVVATLLWLAATWGFSLYLRFADPGSAYGALGALVVLLFFLYVSSIVLLVGAELNAVVDKRYDPEVVRAKAVHPERQTDDEAARRRAEELARREGRSRAEVGLETVSRLVKAEPAMLMYQGRMLEQALQRDRVTEAQVRQALRQQGMASPAAIAAVVLERMAQSRCSSTQRARPRAGHDHP